jgi:hypothetical protein
VVVGESVGCEHGEDLRRAGHGNEQKRERDQVMRDVDMKETDRRPQILFSTGDVMAQQLVEKRGLDKHDPLRTARMGAYGGGTSSLSSSFPFLSLSPRTSVSDNRSIE